MNRVDQLDMTHLDACVAMDSRSPYPWGRQHWLRSLRDDFCLGLWRADSLLAVSAYSLVLDELSLLNIVVDDEFKGQGLGRALLVEGLDWMQQFGAERCILEVRVSNTAARVLYQKLGFIEDSLRKNYYPAEVGLEDAVLMSADLPLEDRINLCAK